MKSLHHHHSDMNSLQAIEELSYYYQKSKVLMTACELGIFSALGNEKRTAKEISHEIDTDENATRRLLDSLVAIGLLNKAGQDQFSNTRGARWYLVKESPDFIGGLLNHNDLWECYSSLTDVIKTGKTQNLIDFKKMTGEQIERWLCSLHKKAKKEAKSAVEMLNISKVGRMLDLGSGSGAYASEFLLKKPELDLTVFDLPNILDVTKKYLAEDGLDERVEYRKGDFFTDDLGKGYDMVFLSNIMHRFSLWENIDLAKKIFTAVNKGGRIVLHDYVLDDNRANPELPTLQSLTMLLTTNGGEVYTKTDLWITLKEAWFRNIEYIDTSMDTKLIIGYK